MTNPTNLTSNQAASAVTGEPTMPVVPVTLIPVRDYTTTAVEFAIIDGDLVFHFYVTDEVNKLPNPHKYWLEQFPAILEKTAQEYFKVEFPRLKAAYTEEKASWWMRAFGFGMVLDPHAFVYKVLDTLDSALDGAMKTST